MTPHDTTAKIESILNELERAVVGKREVLAQVLVGILAGGHVLLEDLPGVGKTLTARSLAQVLGLSFKRAQFTPDLLPADLTGSYIFDQQRNEFVFREGPLFTGLLLADEINRTPPKTQAALLEAMQEHQITVEGTTFALPQPFHVLATANPVEYEGTYPLPEAQLDRFLMRLSFGYPAIDDEVDIVTRRLGREVDEIQLDQIIDEATLVEMQRSLDGVHVDPDVARYCVEVATATRAHPHAEIGASPRGSLALVLCGRAQAVVAARDYVTPEDIKSIAVPALAHRITLRPELWLSDASPEAVITDVLGRVPVPRPAS